MVTKAVGNVTPEKLIYERTLSDTPGNHPTNVTWENAPANLRSVHERNWLDIAECITHSKGLSNVKSVNGDLGVQII